MANYGMLFGGEQLQTPDIYGSYMKGKQDDQVSRLNDLKIAGQQLTNKDTQNQLDMSAFQRLSHTAKGLAAIKDDAQRNRAYQAVLPHLQKLAPDHQWPQAISQQDAQEFATQMDLMDSGGMTESQLKMLQLQISKQNADANTKKADALSKPTVGPDGKSVDAWAIRTLLQGDPNSPEYAAAYSDYSKPKTQFVQTENGLMPVQVKPDMSAYRRPGGSVLEQPIEGGNGAMPPPVSAGNGGVIPGTDKPTVFTETDQKTLNFAQEMADSIKNIDALTSGGYDATNTRDFAGEKAGTVGNFAVSDKGQQFNVEKGRFVDALIRLRTGAAASKEEQEMYGKTWFPVPGDKPETVASKQRARQQAIKNMLPGIRQKLEKDNPRLLQNLEEMAGSKQQGAVAQPKTQADYDSLPSGAIFIDPDDGKQYRKP